MIASILCSFRFRLLCCLGSWMISAFCVQANEPPLIDLAAELEQMSGSADTKVSSVAPKPEAVIPPPSFQEEEKRVDKGGNEIKVNEKQRGVSSTLAHQASSWGYLGKEGPKYWGDLSDKNILCKEGKNQSPVNLKDQSALGTVGLSGLDIYYRDVPLKVVDTGHTIQVNYPLGSYIKLDHERYELLQLHFHTPSEHQKDGFNYPMEAHLVHRDGEGNYVVLGVIFQEGKHNSVLEQLLNHLPKKVGKQEIHRRASLNPAKLLPGNTQFYRYSGSLTTPPCSEGVLWMVFKHPVDVSAEQIQILNERMGDNARPVQPKHARKVLKSWLEPLMEEPYPLYEFY